MKRGEFPFQDVGISPRHEEQVLKSVRGVFKERDQENRRGFLFKFLVPVAAGVAAVLLYISRREIAPTEIKMAAGPMPGTDAENSVLQMDQKQIKEVAERAKTRLDEQTVAVLNFDPQMVEKAPILEKLDLYKDLSVLERWNG